MLYFQDRVRAREESKEVRETNQALTQFSKVASASATTASNLSDSAVKTSDRNFIGNALAEIDSMKTGVEYVDQLLNSHAEKINLHKAVLDTTDEIENNVDNMINTISTSSEPTDGFMKILRDHRKTLTDNAKMISNPKLVSINDKIKRGEEEATFLSRMGVYDTDMSTPEIDWDPSRKNLPSYKDYFSEIINPEAAVARETGDYSEVNKLLRLAPKEIRQARLSGSSSAAKKAWDDINENWEKTSENTIRQAYGVASQALATSNDALNAILTGSPDMKSILAKTSTNLADFGGQSWDAIRTLDTKKAATSIESDMSLLMNIVRNKSKAIPSFNDAFLVKDGGRMKEIIPGINSMNYDPFNPEHRKLVDDFIEEHIYNEETGFKTSKPFFRETGSGGNKAFRTAMMGYLNARKAIHDAVDFVNADFSNISNPKERALRQKQYEAQSIQSPGWFYPEYEAAEDINPMGK
tara:strand:+ start:1218 stop:2621 length:1404 start_codon:yes stop_codon:yes gene_type:complete